MRLRFFSRLSLLVIAAGLIVATQVATGATLEWLAVGAGVLALIDAGIDAYRPGGAQRTLDAATAVIGAVMIVFALVFAGTVGLWLSFGLAGGLALVAIAGMVLHEMTSERVVHSLTIEHEAPIAA
jgi:hypothetical protein